MWAFGRGWERSAFEQRVLRHVLACVTAQLATHIASACSVLLLIHRGDAGADSEQRERVERACPATLVDEALRRRLEERDSTCIVCFSELAVGDRVRSLPCGHTFHTECVDGWWRAPRGPMEAKCPTCKPQPPADDDSEANMGEEERLEVEGAGVSATKAPGDLLAGRLPRADASLGTSSKLRVRSRTREPSDLSGACVSLRAACAHDRQNSGVAFPFFSHAGGDPQPHKGKTTVCRSHLIASRDAHI